mmetsp:Transcript_65108/g.187340  ORF Transcript_65108/g.187340 Transcript_65108/m.187340 type:complete len:864 (-) Transcript_65108:164-2755(-)
MAMPRLAMTVPRRILGEKPPDGFASEEAWRAATEIPSTSGSASNMTSSTSNVSKDSLIKKPMGAVRRLMRSPFASRNSTSSDLNFASVGPDQEGDHEGAWGSGDGGVAVTNLSSRYSMTADCLPALPQPEAEEAPMSSNGESSTLSSLPEVPRQSSSTTLSSLMARLQRSAQEGRSALAASELQRQPAPMQAVRRLMRSPFNSRTSAEPVMNTMLPQGSVGGDNDVDDEGATIAKRAASLESVSLDMPGQVEQECATGSSATPPMRHGNSGLLSPHSTVEFTSKSLGALPGLPEDEVPEDAMQQKGSRRLVNSQWTASLSRHSESAEDASPPGKQSARTKLPTASGQASQFRTSDSIGHTMCATSSSSIGLGSLESLDCCWSPTCLTTMSAHAERLQRLAGQCDWHVVHAFAGAEDGGQEPICEEATVLIVHTDLAGMDNCVKTIKALAGSWGKPILAMLDGVESEAYSREASIRVKMELIGAGVDAVVLYSEDDAHMKWSVDFGIAEAFMRKQIQEKQTQCLQKSLKHALRKREKAHEEPRDGLFWQTVHHLLEDFPKLDMSLPSSFKQGVKFKSCVLDELLGSGQFGSVYSAVDTETKKVEAIKCLDKGVLTSLQHIKNAWMEVCCLRRLEHPNVVALLSLHHAPNHLIIRMAHAGATTLFRELKALGGKMSLDAACRMQAQIFAALEHCHSRNVAHRDIKPENITLLGEDAKLVDFGCAAVADRPADDVAGTMPLIAPEVLLAPVKGAYLPAPGDVWSAGVVFLEMTCGANYLSKLVGWEQPPKVEPASAAVLVEFFSDRRRLKESLQEDLGTRKELVSLLNQCFHLEARKRVLAGDALALMRRGVGMSADQRSQSSLDR